MIEFKLPRSTLNKLPTALLKGVMVALLEEADENGVLTISVREFAKKIGLEYQPLRTALKYIYTNAIANATSNAKLTQRLTQITITDIARYKASARINQRKANATSNATPNATNHPEIHKPDYISPSYVEQPFADTWRKFIAYRNEIHKPYKSEQSQRIAYHKMVELSDHDPEKAKDMVERTILGQWQGLFPNKDNGTKQQNNATPGKTSRYDSLRTATTTILQQSGNIDSFFYDTGKNS